MLFFEEGVYRGRVTAWGFSKAQTGSVQFYQTFSIEGLEDPKDPDKLLSCSSGERTWYRALCSEMLVGWLLSDLRKQGFDGTDLAGLDPSSDEAFDFSDKLIRVRCRHREFKGVVREQWDLFSDKSPGIRRADLEEIRALDKKFSTELEKHAEKLKERSKLEKEASGSERRAS